MKMLADYKIKLLYDEWKRIDIIMKSNLQRRVRKVWLKYKERKAEKARKKKEAAAKKKKGYRGYTKKVDPKPATTVTKPPAQKAGDKKASPGTSAADVKQVSTDPTDPLANTTIDISLNKNMTDLPDRLMQTVGASGPIDEENKDLDGFHQMKDADGNIIRIAQGALGEEIGGLEPTGEEEKLNQQSGDDEKKEGMDYFDEPGMNNREGSGLMDGEEGAIGS